MNGSVPVCELDSSARLIAQTMFGANGLISRNVVGAPAGTTFYAFDERGNVAQRTGGNGAVLSTDVYDGFGKQRAGAADVFGFGGQAGYYTDTETGLILCTNRFYDPQSGRFLTRDPISYGGGINLYSYTANNPVNRMDPSGLMPPFALAGGGVLGGGGLLGGGALLGEGGVGVGGAAVGAAVWPVVAVAGVAAASWGVGTWIGNHIANGIHAQDGLPAPPMNIGKPVDSPRELGLPVGSKAPNPYVPPGTWKPGNDLPGRMGKNGPEYKDNDGNYWRKGPPHHFPGDDYEWDVQKRGGGHTNVGKSGSCDAGVAR